MVERCEIIEWVDQEIVRVIARENDEGKMAAKDANRAYALMRTEIGRHSAMEQEYREHLRRLPFTGNP